LIVVKRKLHVGRQRLAQVGDLDAQLPRDFQNTAAARLGASTEQDAVYALSVDDVEDRLRSAFDAREFGQSGGLHGIEPGGEFGSLGHGLGDGSLWSIEDREFPPEAEAPLMITLIKFVVGPQMDVGVLPGYGKLQGSFGRGVAGQRGEHVGPCSDILVTGSVEFDIDGFGEVQLVKRKRDGVDGRGGHPERGRERRSIDGGTLVSGVGGELGLGESDALAADFVGRRFSGVEAGLEDGDSFCFGGQLFST
jgi:hypothetical protein